MANVGSNTRFGNPSPNYKRAATHDPNAMQVDELRNAVSDNRVAQEIDTILTKKFGKKASKDKGKRKGKAPIKPSSSSTPSSSSSRFRAGIFCHKCGQEGHFMRDCKTNTSQFSRQQIRQIAQDYVEHHIEEEQVEPSEDSEEEELLFDEDTTAGLEEPIQEENAEETGEGQGF
jgi:hypothetical protein